MVTSIIFSIVYGKEISGMDDEYVTVAQVAMEGVSKAAVPGVYWVDYFPFLRHVPSWFPATASRKLAEYYLPYVINMRDKPYYKVKQEIVSHFVYAVPSKITLDE